MSRYTTGELARLCGVSVRTVQYYDTRGILIPSELSEGGRRLYSENDLRRMKIICFLRDAGLSINSISELLSSDDPGSTIAVMLDQQKETLREEIAGRQAQLDLLEGISRGLRDAAQFSVESIGDIAYTMENRKKMRRLHTFLLISGIPLNILQLITIVLWIVGGIWQPFVCYVLVVIPYGVWATQFYYRQVEYICPQCHEIFKPTLREMLWAPHTPTLRKLTCTCCGYRGFCVETYGKENRNKEKENQKNG